MAEHDKTSDDESPCRNLVALNTERTILDAVGEEAPRTIEQQLVAQNVLLKNVLESADAIIFSVDQRYLYTSFNTNHAAVMKALYGVNIELGKSLLDCQKGTGDDVEAKRNLDRALGGEQFVAEGFSGLAESRRYFEVSHNPVREPSGNVVGVSVFARDITARRQLEEAVQRTELRFTTLFTSMDEGFALCELMLDDAGQACDFRYLEVNPAFAKLTGLPIESVVGRRVKEVLPDIEPEWLETFHRVVRTGHAERVVNAVKELGRYFELYAYRVGPVQFAAIFTDVTARMRSEEALRDSERRYRTLGETIPYGVWSTDGSGYCTFVSPTFLEMVGMTLQEVQAFGWLHLLPPEDVEPTKAQWLHCVETGEPFQREHRFRSKESTYRDVLAIGRPVKNERGQVVSWVGLNLDITDRKRVEESQRESEESLRITLNSIGDAVMATDDACRVVRMNPVAERLTGWSLEEAKGRPLEEVFRIINEETRNPVENPATRVLREGIVVGLANHTLLISKDATERPIADSGAPIRDAAGILRGVVLVFRDTTEERAAETALRQSEEKFRATFDNSTVG